MAKEIVLNILSSLGFLLGVIGLFIAIIPFFSSKGIKLYNLILPIVFGIVGLILAFKIKKELNDELVKAGLVINPLAILFGIVQVVISSIK